MASCINICGVGNKLGKGKGGKTRIPLSHPEGAGENKLHLTADTGLSLQGKRRYEGRRWKVSSHGDADYIDRSRCQ